VNELGLKKKTAAAPAAPATIGRDGRERERDRERERERERDVKRRRELG
jgi:hypothetical protein